MAPLKLLNLLALATVVLFSTSFSVDPVNALSLHGSNGHAFSHSAIAKRKIAKRCKVRPPTGTTNSSNGDNSNNDNNNDNNNNSDNNSNSNSGSTSNSNSNGDNTSNGNGDNTGNGNGNGNNDNGTSSNNGAAGNGKVCLAWPNGNDPALANFQTPNSGVIYTWSPIGPADTHGYKFAPMLWGEKQIDDFHANVKEGSSTHILGFNEPEIDGQAMLTPQRAADLWKQNIQQYASQGFVLVSPAVTSAPQSKPWLSDFIQACNDCTIDAVAVHYYGTSPDDLINYITDFHNTFQKPIWLTEYACQNFGGGNQCSKDDVSKFMDKVKAFAESTDWVQQYCWFGAMHDMVNVNPDNQLMDADGKPTPLGRTFLGI